MTSLFEPSDKKIKRAKRKLGNLKFLIEGYMNSNPCDLLLKREGNTTYVIGRCIKDAPDDLAFEVVELVGHLRGALDKAIVNIVENNRRGTSGIGFPFGGLDRATGKPNPFPDARHNVVKKKLTADQWRVIEAYKPYPGGNNVLWSVNEIANEDKHRKDLVKVTGTMGNQGLGIRTAGPGLGHTGRVKYGPSDCDFILSDKERETVLLSLEGGNNVEMDYRVAPLVVFGNVQPVQGKDVLMTLNQQINLVEKVLSDLQTVA